MLLSLSLIDSHNSAGTIVSKATKLLFASLLNRMSKLEHSLDALLIIAFSMGALRDSTDEELTFFHNKIICLVNYTNFNILRQ